ncbi:MAG TPA: DUF2461 domain-containing protein [Actinomycetota bacterium]|nr:DUF2461 domain-containing protein [Actinomycetota bacterium]
MVVFQGWPEEALEFFEGLEADNSKAYWRRHKATYEAAVLAPMEALLDELRERWGETRVMRPYRDIRFSADKSPYKTFIAAMVGPGYVQLNAKGLGAGAGIWEVAPDQLERYRKGVDEPVSGDALNAVVAGIRAAGIDIAAHETLKTAPKGYAKDHPRIEILRLKGLAAWKEWPAGPWLGTPEAAQRVVSFLENAAPLNNWLQEHVGPSNMAPQRR